MTLSEFIAAIGDDNVAFQLLAQCMTNISASRGGSTITFETNDLRPGDVATDTGKVGIVVWADRAAWDRAIAMMQERKAFGAT